MPQTENGIDTEIIAQSCAMAYRAAMGLPRIPFNQISDEDEARWQRLALKAEGLLFALENSVFALVAVQVAHSWHRTADVKLSPQELLAWEAVARHMAMLLECDEVPADLAKQEQAWQEWAKKRLPQTTAAETKNAGDS